MSIEIDKSAQILKGYAYLSFPENLFSKNRLVDVKKEKCIYIFFFRKSKYLGSVGDQKQTIF